MCRASRGKGGRARTDQRETHGGTVQSKQGALCELHVAELPWCSSVLSSFSLSHVCVSNSLLQRYILLAECVSACAISVLPLPNCVVRPPACCCYDACCYDMTCCYVVCCYVMRCHGCRVAPACSPSPARTRGTETRVCRWRPFSRTVRSNTSLPQPTLTPSTPAWRLAPPPPRPPDPRVCPSPRSRIATGWLPW